MMKLFWAFNILLFILIGLMIVEHEKWKQRCEDAGGVPASSVCVNPAAVIEVD
jgi:hypothetical protein